ncbi:MAG: 50S ribosomal protein L3 [Pantoea sp. Brub]|nr:50S ribosomal protein L3 [Pantoea sp. Brub]
MIGLVGKKLGMTCIFNKDSSYIPVTVIKVEENYIVQIKSLEKDGYQAIQVTTGIYKTNRMTKPKIGHFAKVGIEPGRGLWEFRTNESKKYSVGQMINIDIFSAFNKVDITGISKGKGFAGTVKRWNFRTQDASHGNSLSHRVPGSIGQNQTPGRVFKGKKMAGHLGHEKVTIQSLDIVQIDNKRKLLLVKGSIPGAIGSDVVIQPALKK